MLFEGNSLHQLGSGPRFEERKGLLQEVLLDFSAAFPEIEFEIHAESPTINAQAIIHGETRIVRLYGGLAHDQSPEHRPLKGERQFGLVGLDRRYESSHAASLGLQGDHGRRVAA